MQSARRDMKDQTGKYGILSFFTGAVFLDFGFEDAGFGQCPKNC